MGDAPQDDEEETPRERLITNLVLLGLAVLLIGGGIWLANAIFNMRRVQDCAMAGRRNCEQIEVPPRRSDTRFGYTQHVVMPAKAGIQYSVPN
jgi:hypothetical protein